MKIYTSYFGKCKKILQYNITPICIAVGVPKFFNGARCPELAPRYDMLKMSVENYERDYFKILSRLSAADIVENLEKLSEGKDVAIMCYEKDLDKCHRRYVKNWLEKELGIKVKEFLTETERTEQPSLFK